MDRAQANSAAPENSIQRMMGQQTLPPKLVLVVYHTVPLKAANREKQAGGK